MTNSMTNLLAAGKLACPACGGPVVMQAALSCESCNQEYPMLGGMPILMDRPQENIHTWRQQFMSFVASQQNAIQQERSLIASPTCYAPMKKRLQKIIYARTENLQAIADLMIPLRDAGEGTPPREARPADSGAGYFSNTYYLLRDWGWDTGESDVMCNKVKEILPPDLVMESLLVLGAGGCRESYSLHEHYNCPLTVSTDIDPLKLLGASRIISGGELNLYQIFLNNVRDAQRNVSYWELRGPQPPENEFLYMLADATRLPFAENSFQVIFTPFLIDVVGEDLRTLVPKIRRILQPGGIWVNYGAMTFGYQVAYTGEEVLAIVADAGFRVTNHGYEMKPHIAPRESGLQQAYDALYFTAIK